MRMARAGRRLAVGEAAETCDLSPCLTGAPCGPLLCLRRLSALLVPRCTHAVCAVPVRFEGLCGVSPKMLVVWGFVDGLVPPHAYFDGTELTNEQHDKLHAKLVRQLCAALGKARETLLVTCFDEVEGDSAAMLKLRIRRIRLKDGNRVCQVGPSVFLDRLAC